MIKRTWKNKGWDWLKSGKIKKEDDPYFSIFLSGCKRPNPSTFFSYAAKIQKKKETY